VLGFEQAEIHHDVVAVVLAVIVFKEEEVEKERGTQQKRPIGTTGL
jgi:hypothetical protein